MAKKNLNEVFIKGINDNRLSFYKTAKALLKNEDDVEDAGRKSRPDKDRLEYPSKE